MADLADGALMNARDRLALGEFITIGQARDEREPLAARELGRGLNPLEAGHVHGEGLLGEDMLAGGDRCLDMSGTEMRRSRQDHEIDA
jgi:hypothetical protein